MIRLKSKRIILRTLELSDVGAILKNITDKTTFWFDNFPKPYTQENAREYIERSIQNWKAKEGYDFGIIFKDSLIGTISLDELDWEDGRARISYLLNENYWNLGLMSEAVKIILKYSFEKLNFNEIYTGVIEENIASLKILIKFGFEKYETNYGRYLLRNKKFDEIMMRLSRQEYLRKEK